MQIREAVAADFDWIHEYADTIGGRQVVSRGVLHTLADHPGLIVEADNTPVGYAIYRDEENACELLAIQAIRQWQGYGGALLEALEDRCRRNAMAHIWLCTTNDNLPALKFYQRRGYRLEALNPGAFANVLRLKGLDPQKEVLGIDGVPIRDELVLGKVL